MNEIKTVCSRDCYDTCFMRILIGGSHIRIEGDKENPVTRGFLCPRGVADIKRLYSSERILYPHKRVGNSGFKKISWDEALKLLTERMRHVLDEFGPEFILLLEYGGNMGLLTQFLPQRVFYALGASHTDWSICSKSGHEGLSLHYGLSYGIDLTELPSKKLIVYWGFNSAVSAPHLYALSLEARKNGGIIIAIDPRRSETAELADRWIQPKPGSDVALAYGVMKYLIENNLVDHDFIKEYTYGFRSLKEVVSSWSVSVVEEYAGVNWHDIAELARLYARAKPSATMIGIGLQKSLYGFESVRAVSLIPAVIGLHRGFFYTNGNGWNIDFSYLSGQSLTSKMGKVVSQVALGRSIERGEFKLIYIYNMNPAETLPNQGRVRRGLKRDDVFVVVHDTHWTETAKLADLVLPAPTFLEKEDVVISYSHRYVRKSQKVVEPLGESKSELWVTTELAKRLGVKEEWVYEDPWEAVSKALTDSFDDGDISDLRSGKVLMLKRRRRDEYQTSTGKIELYSKKAEKLGLTPLPKQHSLAKKEEGFIFLNSATRKYTHTQFQDVYGLIPPIVHINLKDAEEHNIQEGDIVELYNELGSIRLKAKVSKAVPRGILWAPRECRDINGNPQNAIMIDKAQKLGGGPSFNSTLVQIKKS